MINAPLLSVVIPTRNRACYVTHAVRSIATLGLSGLELVVHDNGDNDSLRCILSENGAGGWLSYYHVPGRLSMAENFELAVGRAKGEYICLIGDDDGILPELLEGAAWARGQAVEALNSNADSVYRWPDLTMRYFGDAYAGTLSIPKFTGRVAALDPERSLRQCARQAGQLWVELPRVYYGIVRRDILDRVRKTAGRVFPGISPDMAAAVAVASSAKRVATVDYPLVLPGNGGASAAGLGARKQHWGRLEDQTHLPSEFIAKWSRLVPPFFSGSTMWAESFVSAVRASGRVDLLDSFNVPLLYALCAVFNPRYFACTARCFPAALRETHTHPVAGLGAFAAGYAAIWLRRARALAQNVSRRRRTDVSCVVPNLRNIQEGVQAYTAFLRERGFNFSNLVRSSHVPSL